jgi:integrase
MPAEVYRRLLDAIDGWKRTPVDHYDNKTQRGRARRLQAGRKCRDGWQLAAIFRLMLNCALDPVDIERVTWSDLHLNSPIPHLRLPRSKAELRVGNAVTRITPLLPSTVTSLLEWRSQRGQGDGRVFVSANGGSYTKNRLSHAMGRLRKELGVGATWSCKHIRNVAPSLAKRHGRPLDERNAILGHQCESTARFYEGDLDEHYLVPLVNLLGRDYLSGKNGEPSSIEVKGDLG